MEKNGTRISHKVWCRLVHVKIVTGRDGESGFRMLAYYQHYSYVMSEVFSAEAFTIPIWHEVLAILQEPDSKAL